MHSYEEGAKMIIRKFKKWDFENYVILEQEFFDYHNKYKTLLQDINPRKRDLRKEFNQLIKEKNFFYIAEDKGNVLGYIYGKIKKVEDNQLELRRIGDLNSLIVTKKYRRKGIANMLVREFIKWLKSKNIFCITLNCNVKNREMIKFAEDLGFKQQHIKFGKLLK